MHDSGNIVRANALQYDWNDLLSADRCSYVIGNPPFVGQYLKSVNQTEDMKAVWGKDYNGYLDYATGWYRKTSLYLAHNRYAAFAFVSTNSITQGQPVPALFKPLFSEGWRIRFAHKTFAWNAQSTDNANVHVVIVGMDKQSDKILQPVLYSYEKINGEPTKTLVSHINPYLVGGGMTFLLKNVARLQALFPLCLKK